MPGCLCFACPAHQTSKPASYAANAALPTTPFDTCRGQAEGRGKRSRAFWLEACRLACFTASGREPGTREHTGRGWGRGGGAPPIPARCRARRAGRRRRRERHAAGCGASAARSRLQHRGEEWWAPGARWGGREGSGVQASWQRREHGTPHRRAAPHAQSDAAV